MKIVRRVRIRRAVGLLSPAILLICLVLTYGVNVPYADQWVFIDAVAKLRAGEPLWKELFSQHNEHRMVFPKLVMIGLAWLTRWNVIAEMIVSVAVAGATLFTLMALAQPILRDADRITRAWVPFILSAIVFSLTQWQNWLWGWQTAWFLAVLAAVSSIALAARSLRSGRPWIWVVAAAAMAIVCQFSLASGIAAWFATALVLAFHPGRWRIIPVWFVLAAATSALYFVGYTRPPHHPTLLAALDQPLALILYMSGYLAGPLGSHAGLGLTAACAFVVLAGGVLRRHWHRREHVVPWIAIGAFAGANALITGIGRVGFGPSQGLESRYVTVSLLLSAALVPLGILARTDMKHGRLLQRVASGAVPAVMLTALVLAADVNSLVNFDRFSRTLSSGRDCLLVIDNASDACLTALYPEPGVVRRLVLPLRSFGWSAFARQEAPPVPTVRLSGLGGVHVWRVEEFGSHYGWVDSVHIDSNRVTIAGWARHPSGRRGPRILVAVDDVIVAETDAVLERSDVALHFHDPGLRRSGWMVRIGVLPQKTPPRRLRVYLAVNDEILVPIGFEQFVPYKE